MTLHTPNCLGQGNNLNNIGRDKLDKATYQIPQICAFWCFQGFSYMSPGKTSDPLGQGHF